MADKLSDVEHEKIFEEKILPEQLDHIKPVKKPTFFMLGGQPGAGKTKVRDAIKGSEKGKGSLVIDPDELRTYHPRYLEHVERDPDTAAKEVHDDAKAWANELRDAGFEKEVNIIYDGTLSDRDAATQMATAAKDSGYTTEVHVIATPLEVSQQSVRGRYEKALKTYKDNPEESAPPRNVPDDVQQFSYAAIPFTLDALCIQGVVSRVRITNRNGDELGDVSKTKGKLPKNAGSLAKGALTKERDRAWTGEELAAFHVNGKEVEGLMQARLDKSTDKVERNKIQQELQNMKQMHTQKVDAGTLRELQGSWIERNLGVVVSVV